MKKFLHILGRFILSILIVVVFLAISFLSLVSVKGITEAEKIGIIVGTSGIVTIVVSYFAFERKKYRATAMLLVAYWIFGLVVVILLLKVLQTVNFTDTSVMTQAPNLQQSAPIDTSIPGLITNPISIPKSLSAPVVNTNKATSVKPYTPGTCKMVAVPYSTIYKNVTYLKQGETMTSQGMDGLKSTCTADSNGKTEPDIISPPSDKIVFVGIGAPDPTPSSTPAPADGGGGLTRDQAMQRCRNQLAGGAGTGNPQGYLINCMHGYGY